MPRFAILEHDWPTLHWDFLLEAGLGVAVVATAIGTADGQKSDSSKRILPTSIVFTSGLRRTSVTGERGTVRRWDARHIRDWIVDESDRILSWNYAARGWLAHA